MSLVNIIYLHFSLLLRWCQSAGYNDYYPNSTSLTRGGDYAGCQRLTEEMKLTSFERIGFRSLFMTDDTQVSLIEGDPSQGNAFRTPTDISKFPPYHSFIPHALYIHFLTATLHILSR